MHIRVRDRQLLLTAPGALCVLDLDRKERGKKHASEFQSERNDHNLALCNVNKLHSSGGSRPQETSWRAGTPQTRAPEKSPFSALHR